MGEKLVLRMALMLALAVGLFLGGRALIIHGQKVEGEFWASQPKDLPASIGQAIEEGVNPVAVIEADATAENLDDSWAGCGAILIVLALIPMIWGNKWAIRRYRREATVLALTGALDNPDQRFQAPQGPTTGPIIPAIPR